MQFAPTDDIDFVQSKTVPPYDIPGGLISSRIPHCQLHTMALRHLINWVWKGLAPPRAPRLAYDENPDTWEFFKKDPYGNSVGGVPSPMVDVPVSRFYPVSYNPDGTLRFSAGFEQPFSAEKLREIYGTRENYRAKFKARLDEIVNAGFFVAEDTAALIEFAESVDF
jgi:hypothetical protein